MECFRLIIIRATRRKRHNPSRGELVIVSYSHIIKRKNAHKCICLDYGVIANKTTIGHESQLRRAYLYINIYFIYLHSIIIPIYLCTSSHCCILTHWHCTHDDDIVVWIFTSGILIFQLKIQFNTILTFTVNYLITKL